MPTYIVLVKLTDQGIKDIKNSPRRNEENAKALEALGGKFISLYATLGEYDRVGILDCPSDEVAMAFLLALGAQGNARTTTLKAFTREEYENIVNRLP